MRLSLRTTRQQRVFGASRSDDVGACKQAQIQVFVEAKRSDLRNGLTYRQRVFLLEKLVGLNDKDAALAAGYSLSVAENTKKRIWKPRVRSEWKRLRREVATRILRESAEKGASDESARALPAGREVTIYRQPWNDGKLIAPPQVALKVPFAFPQFYHQGNAYDFSPDLSIIVYARPGGHADLYLLSEK
jgi:hypothetical protein